MMRESQRSVRHAAKMGALFVASLVLMLSIPSIAFAALMPVYRFYNASAGDHLYTADPAEKASVLANLSSIYSYDGVAYTIDTADPANSHPLYRFFNMSTGAHFYTASEAEKNNILATLPVYHFDGVSYNVSFDPSGAPVYRFLNLRNGAHFWTASEAEKNTVIATLSSVYRFEGPSFYLGHGTALDVTPPVTTSDAVFAYAGLATIHLSATDNVGGSGVAHTYYILDSGVQTTYTGAITVPGSALLSHTLEFWSVDNAGNTEVHHSVLFFVTQDIAVSHALPVGLDCTISGCHDTDLATIHVVQKPGYPTPPGCGVCHGAGVTPSSDCLSSLCHGPSGPHGATVHATIVSTSTDPAACTDAACHGSAGVTGIHKTCLVCHGPDASADVKAAVLAGGAVCETCHTTGYTAIHATGDTPHVVPGTNTCSSATLACHGSANGLTIHATQLPGGPTPPGCLACHNPADPFNRNKVTSMVSCIVSGCHPTGLAVHPALQAVPSGHITTNACASGAAGCHPSNDVSIIHATQVTGGPTPPGCAACHAVGVTPSTNCQAAGCHPTDPHNPSPLASHTVSGPCYACHASTDVSVIHSTGDDPPGCAACHAPGKTASLSCFGVCHTDIHGFTHVNASGTKSSACTACHGTDLPSVHATSRSCFCHIATPYLRAEMAPLLLAGTAECVDCHKGQYAPHGFASSTTTPTASGHSTTTFGTFGGLSKWDGSEGVVVKDSTNTTITQEWLLPTADVFWSQSNRGSLSPTDAPAVAMGSLASAVRTDVGWNSVIVCQDCHTNLDSSMGPQGANVGQVGLDPRFPDDWKTAEITTFDPTGMRSVLTTAGSPNVYYDKALSAPAGNGYSAGTIPVRTICQKCHKLTNYHQGEPAQSRAGRSKLDMGLSNEAHMEHHGDQILGQANCVSCHIAIPHGWVRPRLLVYSNDPAPYVGSQPTTQTIVVAPVGSGLPSGLKGNWVYPTNPLYAGGTQHLDGLNANPAYTKDATSGPVAGGWDQTVYGTEWGAPTGTVQNNCNGCSQTGTTHTPASEGIPVTDPQWK